MKITFLVFGDAVFDPLLLLLLCFLHKQNSFHLDIHFPEFICLK